MPPKVYIIAGPTGSGKTAVALELAKQLHTAVISADSRQCYRGMSIGTAQPTPEELMEVKHFFVNEFHVETSLNVADFEQLALGYLDKIFKNNVTAIVCGGTGLYIKALCEGLDLMPETDPEIESAVEGAYKEKGLEWLQQAVAIEDPVFFATGAINNPARMLRALAFVRTTGISIRKYQTGAKKKRDFDIVKVGIDIPRDELYRRINHRVDQMMAAGLLDEVKQLFHLRHLKNLQTVGYTELVEFLEDRCTLGVAVDKIKQHTRNYAKRQLTWFKKDQEIVWLAGSTDAIVQQILSI